ncbi:hypothetical protein PoB_003883000 [Plakobranchus ocellatus]|uniref:Uncharacterized protein n=1 Tax=Plakobranchus ocellatus TaxID=259542 RepID=A0AAV4AVE3_9GAST|nr:hypothetical protein PoB_003883000 [Plakobranchus ocellatus]
MCRNSSVACSSPVIDAYCLTEGLKARSSCLAAGPSGWQIALDAPLNPDLPSALSVSYIPAQELIKVAQSPEVSQTPGAEPSFQLLVCKIIIESKPVKTSPAVKLCATVAMTSPRIMGQALICVYLLTILMTSLMQCTLGCFPLNDVFKVSCLWTQPLTLDSRHILDVCQHESDRERGSRMTVMTERAGVKDEDAILYDCLASYDGHRYLVKKHNSAGSLGYQCVRFSPLTQRVVRQEWSRLQQDREMVDCLKHLYTLDANILVASGDFHPVPCPVSGGFQALLHRSDNISGDQRCVESISSYKPRVQFQCDKAGSSNVHVDLGPDCTPAPVLAPSALQAQGPKFFTCMDSWQEKGGDSGPFTSVLLRSLDSNVTFWCLHLQRKLNSAHSKVTFDNEVLYQAFLTFDGRCLPHIKGERDVPEPTSMFGKLAMFVSSDNLKCRDKAYKQSCEFTPTKCLESTDCPQSCGRCKRSHGDSTCSLPETLKGTWEDFSLNSDHNLVINAQTITTSDSGDFRCRSHVEGNRNAIYALEQTGVHSSCVPYESCARLELVTPGVLTYQMFSAQRKQKSGEVLSCQESLDAIKGKNFNPGRSEKTVTLMKRDKLQGTSCDIMSTMKYPILNKDPDSFCMLVLHECSEPCQAFNVSLDADSCENRTAQEAGILTQHSCLAHVQLRDNTRALITRSLDTDQYMCFVFLSASLFVVHPEECNQESINNVLMLPDPAQIYDTFTMLKRTDITREKNDAARPVLFDTTVLLITSSLLAHLML